VDISDLKHASISICIPTYNRAKYLARCLNRIVSEIHDCSLDRCFEICISDNNSEDSTQEIVERFVLANSNILINYERRPYNTGFANNLLHAAKMATGRYVFFCGDDDEFVKGALSVICRSATEDAEIIVFESIPILPLTADCKVTGKEPGYHLITGTEQAVKYLGIFHLSFIGNALIRRQGFLENWHPDYDVSAYPHLRVLLAMAHTGRVLFLAERIVAVDDSDRGWRNKQPVYTAIDMARIYSGCFDDDLLGNKTLLHVYMKLVRSIPRAILYERSGLITGQPENPFFSLELTNVMQCYRHSVLARAVALCLWTVARFMPRVILGKLVTQGSRR